MKHRRPAITGLTRRDFLATLGAGIGASVIPTPSKAQTTAPAARPNILWIVSEDNNPYLGCYGDSVARTPTLDGLAARGILYEHCYSAAPVCAPSRFTIISGMYATCCAPAQHMRAQGNIPKGLLGFPAYLRQAGYYCTNNAKTDYNSPISIKDAWDECSRKAHWRNRPKGKPFFAVFNHEVTHESQIFPKNLASYKPLPNPTDPARVRLPARHPDTPEFRRDRANYYDQMMRLDAQVAALLKQLADDGLADDTIVFYYGDNGGILPGSKRFCFDTGLHVPMIVHFPPKFRNLAPADPGSKIAAPISFVDLAPTILSLAGVPIPPYMQGHAFAGPQNPGPQQYAYCFRNRMDERYDFVRSVSDGRYHYLRNYMPHLPHGQHVQYMWGMPSVKVWEKMYREGKLTGPQKSFWEEKPEEELYDTQADPDETRNLAGGAEHQEILVRMRKANEDHMLRIRDNGFIPEGSPLEGFEATRDPKAYPLEQILALANLATKRDAANLPQLVNAMENENECMRYWAVMGCVMLKEKAAQASDALIKRLSDSSQSVRIAAGEALCHAGKESRALPVLEECMLKGAPKIRLQAANALQNIGEKARPALPAMEKAARDSDKYVDRAAAYTVATLKGQEVSGEGK